VSATSGAVTGDAALTVTAATLVSIEVSPAAASVANGLTQQFTATGVFPTTTQDLDQVTGVVRRGLGDRRRLKRTGDRDRCWRHLDVRDQRRRSGGSTLT
jgi:hypothetical protein